MLFRSVCIAVLVYIKDITKVDVNDIITVIFREAFNDNVATCIKYLAILLMTSTAFLNFLGTVRYYNSITNTDTYKSILTIAFISVFIICINHILTLVKLADFGLIITLLSVSCAAFIDRYKKGEIPWIDGFSSAGLFGILALITAKT